MAGLGLLPAGAAPRLTLQLERASLHATLRRLSEHYGQGFTGPHGEGRDTFREDPAAPRAAFEWKDAPRGQVIREVAQAYGLTPKMEPGGDIRFTAGPVAPAGRTQRGEHLSATLLRVDQDETRTQISGVPRPRIDRTVTLHLAFRTQGADAERLHSLHHAEARDDRGRKWELAEVPLPADGPPREPELPDERSYLLRMTGLPEGVQRLAQVEGAVTLYRQVNAHRFEVPLPGNRLPPVQSQGPVRFRMTQLEAERQQVAGAATLGWPEGTELVMAEGGRNDAAPRCSVRLRSGRLLPLETRVQPVAGIDGLAHGARLVVPPSPLPEEAVALVWDVTTRAQPDLEVPFRFDAIPLPLSAPARTIRAPGTSALLIRLGRSISQQEGELSVGLSSKGAAGWGPIRWRTVEVMPGAPARVEGLAPGSYRISLRFRRRGADGRLGAPVTLPGAAAKPLQLLPNREIPLQAAP